MFKPTHLIAGVLWTAVSSTVFASSPVPSELYFPEQWALHNDGSFPVMVETAVDNLHTVRQSCGGAQPACVDIGWLDAQPEVATQAKAPVVVSVIDTGVDFSHPDLSGRLTGDGWDFLVGSPFQTDSIGHGTSVSGIIAAISSNGVGISGVAPASVKVQSLVVVNNSFRNFRYPDPVTKTNLLQSDFVAAAIRYAVLHHSSVINISLGWPAAADTANARAAVAEAIAKGVLIVASANNSQSDEPDFPCSYPGVLCVGSVNNVGAHSVYSNFGARVDLVAPGEWILSTIPMKMDSSQFRIQGYDLVSGTSFSAPIVAAMAATIKSAHPSISLNELVARLMLSTGAASAKSEASSSLYGLVNLARALDASPAPVYYPDFKSSDPQSSSDGVVVDEATLTAQGSVSIKNLWADATGVQARVRIDGAVVGSAQAERLAGGQAISVPWKYAFQSLNDPSELELTVEVSDQSGNSRSFYARVNASRAMESIAKKAMSIATSATGRDAGFIGASSNGQLTSSLNSVISYASPTGLPIYYRQLADTTQANATLQILDPSNSDSTPEHVFTVPGIQQITGVYRVDVRKKGEWDWVVMGLGTDSQKKVYFEIYYMDPNFAPLTGDPQTSQWHIANPVIGNRIFRNYGLAGSWLSLGADQGGNLVPCLIDSGQLPPKDNSTNVAEPGHFAVASRLYYVSPLPSPPGVPVRAELRALNNYAFAQAHPTLGILSALPQSQADQKAGHLRILMSTPNGDSASPVSLWDVRSNQDSSVTVLPGWNSLLASGQVLQAQTSSASETKPISYGLLDASHAVVSWSGTDATYLGHSDFDHRSPSDPLNELIGAFDLGAAGRVWFMSTGFELAAYTQSAGFTAPPQASSISIDRDATFPESQFVQTINPMLLGTAQSPVAGVLYDRSLLYGNRLYAIIWDTAHSRLAKPLRYSFRVPSNCLHMDPTHLDSRPESFVIPLICGSAGAFDLDLVQP